MYIGSPEANSASSDSSGGDDRRGFLKRLGFVSTGGLMTSLAGCLGGNGDDDLGDPVESLEFVGYPEANANRYETLTTIVEEINSLGFDIEYNPVSRDRQLDRIMFENDFDMGSLGYTGRPERLDPNAFLWTNYHSSEATGGAYNWTGLENDEVDAILEEQRGVIEPDERQPLIHEAQEIIMGLPGGEMPIQHNDLINVYNSEKFDGFSATPGLGLNNYDTWVGVEALTDEREMTCAYPIEVPHITPLDANETNMITQRLCHDSLTVVGEDGMPEPWLAEDWEIADDQMSVEFEIAEGHEFTDGEPCTADDVVFTYEYILEYEVPFFMTSVERIDEVYADGNTVTFELIEPDGPIFHDAFSRIHILPEHIWSQVPEEVDGIDTPGEFSPVEEELTGETLIGSGPYEFDEWRRGEGVRLTVRDSHPVATPDIDSIFIQTIESPSALTTALRNEEIDFVIDSDADAAVLDEVCEEEDHLEFVATDTVGYDELAMRTTRAPLDRESVRQAMSIMIPKEMIADEIWQGYAIPAHSPIAPSLEFWYNDDVTKWSEMTVEDAIEILEDDGFTVTPDGIYYPPEE